MRLQFIVVSVLLMVSMQAKALPWDVYSLNQNPVPHTALVSFSIGYPKGWSVSEDPSLQRRDIYYDIACFPSPGPICIFAPPASTSQLNHPFRSILIWRADGFATEDSMDKFIPGQTKDLSPAKNLGMMTTSAGVSGCLVERTGQVLLNPLPGEIVPLDLFPWNKTPVPVKVIPIICHDYIFHYGKMEPIRIEIMTETTDSKWLSQMDNMVLETLKF